MPETPRTWTGDALIAFCPEHGLHGERDACFVCGKPVEQVPMVPSSEAERMLDLLGRGERREASLRGRLKLAADRLEEHDLEHDLDLEAHSERCTGHIHGPCDCGAES